jgi:hypothetical protein
MLAAVHRTRQTQFESRPRAKETVSIAVDGTAVVVRRRGGRAAAGGALPLDAALRGKAASAGTAPKRRKQMFGLESGIPLTSLWAAFLRDSLAPFARGSFSDFDNSNVPHYAARLQ